MNQAEFRRREKALYEVLDEHLGPSPENRFGLINAMAISLLPAGKHLSSAMRRKQEHEKLERIKRAAREFASAWQDLHHNLKNEMKESGRTYFCDKMGRVSLVGSGPLKDCSDVFWQAVDDLNKIIGPAVPKARALIEASPELGKVDMKTVEIVHGLRITWEHRKGKPAPKSVAEGSAFYKFVDAVFTVLELKREVRSAMDAWRKFDRSHPKKVRSFAYHSVRS
jgi:hypothetical protein